ncbi:hypothetical protein DFP94_11541 [Fontibacillus phaseoli]|uniref:Uncharacterized protein n=1 Tax=Fontibacillus phaseoli TaxID=1416533 RepID=A0A369B495_9BACL|nr:hypothetical protein [Fontibacillus phaseoli]RCX15357.1 hypothetical protein DFP94_11541 [Fontibacillus phaseoli]
MQKYRACKRRISRRGLKRQLPTAGLLRKVAFGMAPFYKAIVYSQGFADAWSQAVVGADLDRMRKLLYRVAPRIADHGMGTNGIGYFISFKALGSYYSCGITIPPGRVQFYFNPKVHRLIARALLPFFRELVCRSRYASVLARAIRRHDRRAAARLVRCRIKTLALKSVKIEDAGLVLTFKYPFSKYEYTFVLFREFN